MKIRDRRVRLTGPEVSRAIDAYLAAHGVIVTGPRTVYIEGEQATGAVVVVNPGGFLTDGRELAQVDG